MDWLKLCLSEFRCYHSPIEMKNPDGSEDQFGVNTRNMDPMKLLHVSRRIDYAWVLQAINNPAMAHEQDLAKY